MKRIKPAVADRIQTLRIQKGYSQEQLAEKLGVSLDTVKGWESGRRTPKGDNMKHLCLVLHTKEEYILNGDDSFSRTLPKWDKVHRPIIQFIQTAVSLDFFHYSDPSDSEKSQKEENDYIAYNKQYEERQVNKMKKEEIKVILNATENRIIDSFETGEIIIYAVSEADVEKGFQHLMNRGIIAE